MKVMPIDKRLYKALCRVSNEMNDIVKHMTENDFEEGDKNQFTILKEATELLDEYTSCFTGNGDVAQRGLKPSAWNENTIFTDDESHKPTRVDEISPEEKDANAKAILEELT